MATESSVPSAFFWRRMHSLMGVWLVIYLMEHLLTNSQAALWFGDDGNGFVRAVNAIQGLPYLHVIEILLLGVPFFIHIVWGIKYLWTSKINSFPTDGTSPYQPYPKNRAYTWQRIVSWVLIFAILAHAIEMRFLKYPESAQLGSQKYYMVKLTQDEGLFTLAERLNVKIFDENRIHLQKTKWQENVEEPVKSGYVMSFFSSLKGLFSRTSQTETKKQRSELLAEQETHQEHEFLNALEKYPLHSGEVIAIANNFGTAELLVVRETFKNPLMLILYTFFVLASTFHAFNGLWTALITWGITLTERSQYLLRKFTNFLMILFSFLGLAAIWGTYLVTLKS